MVKVSMFVFHQEENLLNMSTRLIVKRAREKNIPVFVLDAGRNYIQLGLGARGEKIKSTKSRLSNPASTALADSKIMTNTLLQLAGIPNPAGTMVETLAQARTAAARLRWPVVVKPAYGTAHGHGVGVNITNNRVLATAFQEAKQFTPHLLIEKYVSGEEYRFIIINSKVVAVTNRVPAHVMGDGRSTVQQLVRRINRDPARGGMFGSVLSRIIIDKGTPDVLKKQGYTTRSIPDQGARVFLTFKSNIGLGGLPVDITDEVSRELKELALSAARVIGLPVAGIDIIADHPRSTTGMVLEVNGVPGIYPQMFPVRGKPRDTVGLFLDALFPSAKKAYIPILNRGRLLTRATLIEKQVQKIPKAVAWSLNGKKYTESSPTQPLLGYLINQSVTKVILN